MRVKGWVHAYRVSWLEVQVRDGRVYRWLGESGHIREVTHKLTVSLTGELYYFDISHLSFSLIRH